MKSAGRCHWCRSLALVATCLLAVASCKDSGATADDPTITPPETTSASVTTAVATTATMLLPLDQDPPVIDLAYAQRVLDTISHLDGEASRILFRDKRMTAEAETILTSIFFGSSLEDNHRALETDLSVGLKTWRDPPGDPVLKALTVVSGRAGCIALRADSDLRPRYSDYSQVQRSVGIILQRNTRPTPAERQANPTLWLHTVSSTSIGDPDLRDACK